MTLSRLKYLRYFNSDEMSGPYFGYYDSEEEMCGQIIFREDTPSEINPEKEPSRVELLFRYPRQEEINIKMLAGVFEPINSSYPDGVLEEYPLYITKLLKEELTYYEKISMEKNNYTFVLDDHPITTWDYSEVIRKYDLDYVVSRDPYIYQKVSEDPKFHLVFNCGNVSIFQVNK